MFLFFGIVAAALASLSQVRGCTTFVVGRKATVDGSVMATHTNDGGGTTDARLVKVPARDFAPGSLRPIYASPENYPRYVGTERQVPQYWKENCQAGPTLCKDFEPIGYIPQVNHTFAYLEATYGVLNEKQVGLAESTCSGVFATTGKDRGGKALLTIDALSQIAMERASTAREAVSIMGELGEKYGFYGEAASIEGGSESLLVTDPLEAWVFHILADPTGTSAIWVGARVPDDSFAVVANMFSIRVVDLKDTANFLGRADMWELAELHGLWNPTQPKDFTATFSDGEYAHKYYSGRRMWAVFQLFAPSLALPAEYGDLKTDAPYPFTARVDYLLSIHNVTAALRSWYEGTPYSTSTGLAGGPFGTPDRYSGGAGEQEVSGNWERTIALYRSSDSYVVQSREEGNGGGGVVWFGPAAAHATVYLPVSVEMQTVPDSLAWPYQGVYNLSTNYWANRNVLTLAQVKFSYMIQDIRRVQQFWEERGVELVGQVVRSHTTSQAIPSRSQRIQQVLEDHVHRCRDAMRALADQLFFTYADGAVNTWTQGKFSSKSVGYPAWWLEAVGYPDGPPPVQAPRHAQQ